ncbi:MAG: short-chain fatty acyl-CoA regulator family protein [Pseudomonadota bacterium]
MVRTILGTRIRERRRQIGVTQAALAQRIGISPSYLNLIESNKRRIAGPLLSKAAEALDLDVQELDGAAERRLLEVLNEVAHLPSLAGLGIEDDKAGELIGRYPGWARALAALARSEHDANQTARALADRLSHDPFLGETVHLMLTRIASIRSAAEILSDYSDIPAAQQARFHGIVYEESDALSDVGEALAAYFDKIDQVESKLTPLDEVEALFDAHENHFAAIEAEAIALQDAARDAPDPRALAEEHLQITIRSLIAQTPQVQTDVARGRAERALLDYAAAAIQMPMTAFAKQAEALRFDIEALAAAFQTGVDAVCSRLTALPRDLGLPRFGYFRANAAGTIIEMLGLPDLNVPRYAAACPLWVLYRAQQAPEAVMRQRALFPSGLRFVFVARARNTGATGFGRPRHFLTDMVVMSEEDAQRTVYAPGPEVPVEEVGPACRICPRTTCPQRVEDPFSR